MSRTAATLVTLIVLCYCSFFTNGVETGSSEQISNSGTFREGDPSWNYLNHGSDWDFNYCNMTAVAVSPGNAV